MKEKTYFKTGIVGALVSAVCCFTSLTVILLGALGLSAWLGWVDYVLFPIMFASLGIVANALYVKAGRPGLNPKFIIMIIVVALSALLILLEFQYAFRIIAAVIIIIVIYSYYLRRLKISAAH